MQLEFLHGSMVIARPWDINRIYPLINIGTVYFHHGDNK